VALFYCAMFGLIATNSLFAISFASALVLALVAAWGLGIFRSDLRTMATATSGRLASAALGTAVLGFVFIFFIYPVAGHGLKVLDGLFDSIFLTTEATSQTATGAPVDTTVNPYAAVVEGWTSLEAYFILSIANYLLMATSAAIWIWRGFRWILGKEPPGSEAQSLLWFLYAAFALQGALAIFSDRSSLVGANLQHRSFPSFALLAIPLVASALGTFRLGGLAKLAAAGAAAALACLAVIKVTTEPGVSNKWTFYTPAEMHGIAWVDQHQSRDSIWIGLDERLSSGFRIVYGHSMHDNSWDIAAPSGSTRTFLISNVIELQSARLRRPLPPTAGENLIYDNCDARLYRLRPRSPFQQ
jgi:hypothetical protein